jgi:LPXTG-motif cell wall-anchored protein
MSFVDRIPRPVVLAAFWAATVAVGVLALLPAAVPLPTTGWDKSNHALAFAVLGLLGAAAWPASAGRVWLALAAYGGAIEIAQTFTETRMGEWIDWAADLIGLAMAAVVARKRPAR